MVLIPFKFMIAEQADSPDKVSIVNNKVLKQNLLTKLDFNAIAKGYAVAVSYTHLTLPTSDLV